jgi:hypothetical protein
MENLFTWFYSDGGDVKFLKHFGGANYKGLGTCGLAWLKERTKYFSQNGQHSILDLNPGPSKYEAPAVIIKLRLWERNLWSSV